jgi:hypothetical protein
MKVTFLAAILAAALMAAAPLSQSDRDFEVRHLQMTRDNLLDAVKGLSDSQWRFKPAPDVWSVAECAEHIALSEDSVFQLAQDTLKNPGTPKEKAEASGKDQLVIKIITDRTKKAQAPGFLRPTNRWKTKDELLAYFEKSRNSHIHYVETTQDDLRGHFGSDEDVGVIDAYQFLLLMSAHSERHTKQLLEIEHNPKFPK